MGEWIQLINAESVEELEMIQTGNKGIIEAIEVVKAMSLGKRLRMAYEAHLKAVRDRWAEDEYIKDIGRAEGKAAFVQNMLKHGFSDEEICELAECTVEFINRFRQS